MQPRLPHQHAGLAGKTLRAAVWLTDDTASSRWSCDECSPEQRRARGNCGGPFTEALGAAMPDEQGRLYVDENVVVSTMTGAAADDRHYSCPVAASRQPWVMTVMTIRRRLEGGERMTDILDGAHASALLRACVDIASQTVNEVREAAREWRRRQRDKT